VTYQLAALRFRSIGERSARFTDLTLKLTAPAEDGLIPQDSVIWLRNGGGKSSILSLLYAQLLPRAAEFMGRSVKRSLTDYVGSGDTAHVVAVWQPSQAARDLLGEPDDLLVTGAVYEWDDLRRPAQAAESRDRLNTSFYAFHAVPGVLDLETLPFADAGGRPCRLSGFVQALREQARPCPRANLVVTEAMHMWAKALLDRHLDPALFRTQKQMNHVEGGVEDLFKFPAAKDFIDFLLDLTIQPDAPASLAKRLASVTELLAAKPRKISERDFCVAAAGNLDEIAGHHGQVRTASAELAVAVGAAVHLAAAFASAIRAAQEQQRDLQTQHEALGQSRTTANSQRSQANDLLYLYRREGARLRLAEAKADQRTAEDLAKEASTQARAWGLVGDLAAQADLASSLARAAHEAAAEEAELAPLRDQHARHASRLRLRLTTVAEEADLAGARAAEEQQTASETADREQQLAEQAQEEQQQATADEAAARTQLDALDQRRQDGVRRGHLPAETTAPGPHLADVTAQRERLDGELIAIEEEQEKRRMRRNEIAKRDTDLAAQHSTADSLRSTAAQRRAGLASTLTVLTNTPRVRELVEAAPDEPVDLWAEAHLLERRLGDAVIVADDERILRRAEQHADLRTMTAQERNQTLPSTIDAEHVVREITDAGFTADPGWIYLRSVLPADQLLTALDMPGIARLGCGAVVPTGMVADAVRALDSRGVSTTSLVGVYSAETADAIIQTAGSGQPDKAAPAWMALQPGLVDPGAAEAAVRLLRERANAYQLKDQELKLRRDSDDELRREITRFIDDCPAGHLAALDTEIEALDNQLQAIGSEQAANRTEIQRLDDSDRRSATARRTAEEQLRVLDSRISWLEDLIYALSAEGALTAQLADAQGRGVEAGCRARRHAQSSKHAAVLAKDREEAAKTARLRAQGYRSESAGIPAVTASGKAADALTDDPVTPLDTLRRAQRESLKALEVRASQSVLADRVRSLSQQLADAATNLELVPLPDRRTAEQLLASPDGQEPHLRSAALERARLGEQEASAGLGAARSRVEQRQNEADEVERQYSKPPRRALPTVPATSAEADALAAEQEAQSQQAKDRMSQAEELMSGIDRQMAQVKTREQLLSALLDALPSSDTRPGSGGEPFTHDEDAARLQARRARGCIDAAEKQARAAETGLNAAVDRLRRTASRLAGITGPIRDRLSNDPPSVLGPNASDLAAKLRLRAQTLDGELESIAKDQLILSEALAHLVRESLDLLGRAERGSQMKTTLGSWAGRKILRISFDRPSDSDLPVYAERVIDRVIQNGLKPEGMPLLKAAVHEAAGPRGFTVKVLKPTDDDTATTEDISRLAKWSGGEKLTVCVALYCILAALRAAHTGGGARSGGVLLLDNPIGRASASSLVRLQRDVAASHGVQLVYTTGVKDPAAVIQFPNVIRLDNREGRTRNRRYIVADPADRGGTVNGIRAAHGDHPWDVVSGTHQRTG
jgi:hypothetical protein